MATPFATGPAFNFLSSVEPETNARVTVLADGTLAVAAYQSTSDDVVLVTRNIDQSFVANVSATNEVGAAGIQTASIAALANGQLVVGALLDVVGPTSISFDRAGTFVGASFFSPAADDVRVAAFANGDYVVAATDVTDNYFQIVRTSGSPILGTADSLSSDSKPEIATLADGGFVIGGVSNQNGGDPSYFIYEADGTPRASGFSSVGGVAEDDTFVFGLANGNFVSVFTNESGSDGDGDGIYGVIHGPDGTPATGLLAVGTNLSVNTTESGNQNHAAGIGLSDGGFVVTWTDTSADANGDIRAQAFNADGAARGSEFTIAEGSSNQDDVSVAEMADGRLTFVWEDDVNVDFDIRARIFDPRESAITRNGTSLGDQWVGTIWSDTLRGQDGDDLVSGGAGDDLIEGGKGADQLSGDGGNDIIRGGDDADVIDGGAGFDQLIGEGGDDVYVIDGLDTVVETIDGGRDTVASALNIDLQTLSGGFIEDAFAIGNAATTLIGNAGANTLGGDFNPSANVLIGLGGGDFYSMGVGDQVIEAGGLAGGIDTIFYGSGAIDLTLSQFGGGNVENATMAAGGFSISGNGLENRLIGAFDSAANALNGLAGDDTYSVDGLDTVSEAPGAANGNDTIITDSVNINLGSAGHGGGNVENARALGTSTISLTGNGSANQLDGLSSTGANALIGLGGNDTYIIGAGDTVSEVGGSGTDDVQSDTISLNLNAFAGIENAKLYGTSNLNVTGNAGANALEGNLGVNIITGGLGRDTMTGGGGADDFDFNAITETGKTAATRDKIIGFVHLIDDIDLSTIDANGAAAGNTAFQFRAAKGAAFTGFKGQIRWLQENKPGTANDKTIIQGDVNGDKLADFHIELKGLITLTAADFML